MSRRADGRTTPATEPARDEQRWQRCLQLARELLLVGPGDRDLKLDYLKVLIDTGLPKTDRPLKILVVGAGIAGLVAADLLKAAGHQVTIIEGNSSRIGGRLKTFRKEPGKPAPFADPHQYAEAGGMRLPNFHPLTLALVDKLRLRRRLFFNVDIKPGTGDHDEPVPPVTYRSFTGEEWRNGPDSPGFTPPEKANRTWIRVNGHQVRRADYLRGPKQINASFGMPPADHVATTSDLLKKALDPIRDYYSVADPRPGADPERVNKPLKEWIEGWARVIYELDEYSMRRFLKERAGLSDEAIAAIGTIENLTSRMPLSFFHSFLGRSDLNPKATYWEIEGGSWRLPYAFLPRLRDNIRLNRRLIRMEYWDPDRDCSACTHVGPDGPAVWLETVTEEGGDDSTSGTPGPDTEEFTGDVVIMAIPFSSLRHVIVNPLLSNKKRRAIIELHYDSATKVLLEFSKRWWEFTEQDWQRDLDAIHPGLYDYYQELDRRTEAAQASTRWFGADDAIDERAISADEMAFYTSYRDARPPKQPATGVIGGGSTTDNPSRFMYYPSHPVPGSDGGVVLASYSWADDAARWDAMADEERYAFALRYLQLVHGKRIEVFYTGHGQTQSWLRNRYAFGEAAVFTPGQLTDFHLDIPTPEGPVYFAGEHVSLKHAWIEGSVETAVRAAIDVNARAETGPPDDIVRPRAPRPGRKAVARR